MLLLSACGGGEPAAESARRSEASGASTVARAAAIAVQAQADGIAPSFGLSSAPQRPKDAPFDVPSRPLAADDEGYRVDTSQREASLLFLRSVHDSSTGVPVGWTGSFTGCDAGDTSAANKAAVERRINWVRAMAGVPAAVRLDPSLNQQAQKAALIMAAQGQLSHTPPDTWACWTSGGFEAAGKSNLTQTAGASSITNDYLHDFGDNNPYVGHRRWLLYPQTRTMGTGDVQGVLTTGSGSNTVAANALWVFDSQMNAARPAVRDGFVAWPPPGYVPHTTVYPRWSISYPDADFSQATVSVTESGRTLSTVLEPQSQGYGENTLVWFVGAVRDGADWPRPAADMRYQVTVSNVRVAGVARSFSYAVTVFDADTPAPWAAPGSVRGSTKVTSGQATRFDFNPVAGATAYQFTSRPLMPLVFADGAESGGAGVQLQTSAGYDAMPAGVAPEGSRYFHLAHAQAADQILTLRPIVVPGASTRLRFASRLALATAAQSAVVEVSSDEGRNWTALYWQSGTGDAGERSFVTREISLAAYAGQTLQVRLRYARPTASYYPQTTDGVGWYIDDLRVLDAETVTGAGSTVDSSTPSQALALPAAGRWLVQARPGMFGQWPAWSAGLVVQAATHSTRLECLFDWAQTSFPDLLRPRATTASSSPYLYRAYANEFYVGWSSADAHIYTLNGSVLSDLGPADGWMGQAGC